MTYKKLNRRDLFTLGAQSLVLAPLVTPLFRDLLYAQSGTTPPKILFIHCDGGWDPTLVFDPKIGTTEVAQETGAAAATGLADIAYVDHPDRPSVKAFFEAQGDKCLIVNGISCGSMSHEMALRRELGGAANGRFSDWLSFYAGAVGSTKKFPHLVIDAPFMPGSYAPHAIRLSSEGISERAATLANATELSTETEDALHNYLANAYSDLQKTIAPTGLDADKLAAFRGTLTRDTDLTTSLLSATTATATAGDSTLLRHAKIAIELMRADLTQAATIQAGGKRAWDSHSDHFTVQSQNFSSLFADLTQIVAAATAANLATSLVIIVTSELGRGPSLNAANGKPHWPYTSALLWGNVWRGGATVGSTDAYLRGQAINPVFGTLGGEGAVTLEMAHIMAGLFLKYSIDAKGLVGDIKPLSTILGTG